ncbi:MAG: ATP-binding cassette domain-containing protein [Polyangiaceae bacterium]
MNFNAGSRYGIVGANGLGKSTILRIVARAEEASAYLLPPQPLRIRDMMKRLPIAMTYTMG